MIEPRITTIIPTFQRPKLLRRSIESVLSQTVGDFLLHIHDNASQDETQEVVAEYQKKDTRIRYFRRETNVGLVLNFVLAFEHISTPYFSYLSDDDFLLPHFYETTLEGFTKHPEAGFSAGRTLICSGKGKLDTEQFLHTPLEGFFPPEAGVAALLDNSYFPSYPGILFKTAHAELIGGLDPRPGYAFDLDLTLRFASSAPTQFNPKPVAIYMSWDQSASQIPLGFNVSNFDSIIQNTLKVFSGSLRDRENIAQKLQAMQQRGFRRIWIHSLLANRLTEAIEARKKYVQLQGPIRPWQMKILTFAEEHLVIRKSLQFYCYLRKSPHFLLAYFRKTQNLKRKKYSSIECFTKKICQHRKI